jgi:superfamily I DNA/RNA helicase/mRNA-degrading endonuclease RelE of RelBE toxin-antitoxin system
MVVRKGTSRIEVSKRCFDAIGRLPEHVRAALSECLTKLRQDPAHPSLNYEVIRTAADPRMRSIRINEQYRAIVTRLEGSNAPMLLWVDKHDEAYAWSARHKLDTDNGLDGLTIVEIRERQEEQAPRPVQDSPISAPEQGMLRYYTDQQLIQSGVPDGLLPALRRCKTDDDLERLLDRLPSEIAQRVLELWTGEPLAVPAHHPTEQAPEMPPAPLPEASSVTVAVQRPGNARHFVVISSQEELEQALKYPLELWRVFLHPEQKDIVRKHFDGPALVSGGAGTGKTVVGLHRARYLAAEVFTAPQDRVLLTTFTINLADNLSRLMDSLCEGDPTTRHRIEVTHVHSLVAAVRNQAREPFDILGEDQAQQLMSAAVQRYDTLGLSASFYLAEWQEVVQEREALTEDAYLQVDRAGRGRGLSRRQRVAIWPVLAAYEQAVAASKHEEWSAVVRRARHLIETHRVMLPRRYRAVIVDEAQDMGTPEMRFLLALVGQGANSLLLLGDTRQQIYARGSYARLLNIPFGRRHMKLRLNYRTTEQIREAASSMVVSANALTGEPLGPDDSISLLRGPSPTVRRFASQAEEEQAVVKALREMLASSMLPLEIVVVARVGAILTHYANLLLAEGIPCSRIEGKGPRGAGVQLATMHRVKGLEFRAVFIVGCSANVLPQPYMGDDDEAAHAEHEERERRLLYVAMTRARELLWISGAGQLSAFLARWADSSNAEDSTNVRANRQS